MGSLPNSALQGFCNPAGKSRRAAPGVPKEIPETWSKIPNVTLKHLFHPPLSISSTWIAVEDSRFPAWAKWPRQSVGWSGTQPGTWQFKRSQGITSGSGHLDMWIFVRMFSPLTVTIMQDDHICGRGYNLTFTLHCHCVERDPKLYIACMRHCKFDGFHQIETTGSGWIRLYPSMLPGMAWSIHNLHSKVQRAQRVSSVGHFFGGKPWMQHASIISERADSVEMW